MILIVDDEELIRWTLRERLSDAGHEVGEAQDGATALKELDDATELVLLDLNLPDQTGLTLIPKILKRRPDLPIIMMTADASYQSAVEAIKLGAYHYLTKPVQIDELLLLVDKALETQQLRSEVKRLRATQHEEYSFDAIIGQSPAMQELKNMLQRVARSPASTVLLSGESGTGKDLAAKVLHYNSDRAAAPFMNITCSAIPEALLESELFGHEKGSFTGADRQKKGLFEEADGGTVFLDEIGEMPLLLQSKLLRFLEDKTFRRVGGTKDIRPNVRIVGATNRKLQDEVREGNFREDLYYRLSVLPIEVPPLRERRGDIPLLVNFYVNHFRKEFRKNISNVSPDAIRVLESHTWPGNIRELKNAVERAMLLCDGDLLEAEDFQIVRAPSEISGDFTLPADGLDFEKLEQDLVRQALERTKGNQTQAAKLLGMNRDQIRYRIEKFGLSVTNTQNEPTHSQ